MDKPLKCEQIQQTIDEMSGSQLQEAQIQGPVHDHVQACPACRDHLADALALAERLDQWEVPQAGRNIAASVMAQIAQWERRRARQTPGPWGQVTALLRHRLQIPVAAVVPVLVALTVSVVLNVSRVERSPSPRYAVQPQPTTPSIPAADTPALDRQVTQPKVVYVGRPQDSQAIRSFLARPELSPSALIVILGTPPIVPLEPESKTTHAAVNNSPL